MVMKYLVIMLFAFWQSFVFLLSNPRDTCVLSSNCNLRINSDSQCSWSRNSTVAMKYSPRATSHEVHFHISCSLWGYQKIELCSLIKEKVLQAMLSQTTLWKKDKTNKEGSRHHITLLKFKPFIECYIFYNYITYMKKSSHTSMYIQRGFDVVDWWAHERK